MGQKKLKSDAVVQALREYGLAYPGAHTKSPWPGHADLAVRDKTFAYLSSPGEAFYISCKLPHSSHTALALPFAQPTAWGLGKSGWVTATFSEIQSPPLELFKDWIDESYRAQAPKKLVAQMDAHAGISAAKAAGQSRAAKKAAKRGAAVASRPVKASAAKKTSPAKKRTAAKKSAAAVTEARKARRAGSARATRDR
jgi:predicted DNA-binding protein (MmcQ/YjbR family)